MVARDNDLPAMSAVPPDLPRQIAETLVPFEAHFGSGEFASYDPTDIYDTSLGRRAKKAWAKDSRAAAFLYATPLLLLDIFTPSVRKMFAKRKTHPICLAQAGLAFLRLAQVRPDAKDRYVSLARRCYTDLQTLATATRSGIGWGLDINWETQSGAMPPMTPCHTQTSYVFELITALSRLAPSDELTDCLERIAKHTAYDYMEFEEPVSRVRVTGYSVIDKRAVLNAQSYRMVILLSAYKFFGRRDYLERAVNSLEFLLRWQAKEGAWPYSPEEPFVDGYHTCFILKNLVEAHRILRRIEGLSWTAELKARAGVCIESGYRYFLQHLLDTHGRPIPFSVANKPVLYRYDAYDLAEALNLLSLFGDFHRVARLIGFFRTTMRLSTGLGRYRYYGGVSRIFPGSSYDRYANSAFFLAGANALHRLAGQP